VLDAKGDPENPLSSEELLEKYCLLTKEILPEDRIQELSGLILELELVSNVNRLTKLMTVN